MKFGLEWELTGLQGTARVWLERAIVRKKGKLSQSLLGMAQYYVHKQLWVYHEGQSCPAQQIHVGAMQMPSAASRQCWARNTAPMTL